MRAFLIVVIIVLAVIAFKYYITSLVFAAWIAEKEYEPPTDKDIARLAKWVAHKMINKSS